jgi:GntR family transcriptional regulator/MocR family aminotransferase
MLFDVISRDFTDHLELIPSTTGLHLTALARRMSVDQVAEIARRAANRSVAVQILSSFAVSSPPSAGLMLGYGAIPTVDIEEGLRLLRTCFNE